MIQSTALQIPLVEAVGFPERTGNNKAQQKKVTTVPARAKAEEITLGHCIRSTQAVKMRELQLSLLGLIIMVLQQDSRSQESHFTQSSDNSQKIILLISTTWPKQIYKRRKIKS